MMLEHLGLTEAAALMLKAMETVLARAEANVLTPDMGGKGTTVSFGDAIEAEIIVAGQR